MDFETPYLHAMRDRAPKMFNQLVRSGQMEEHLQEKSTEAHRMFEELTADAPKLPNGLPRDPWGREAEEVVFATLIEFPSDSPDPSDPLSKLPE